MNSWQAEHILLGRGGVHPGLAAYDLFSGTVAEVSSLPEGQSVYSIDVWPGSGMIAAGAKSGRVYLFGRSEPDGREGLRLLDTYEGYVPVLSICFVGPSVLAIADAAGGVLLWHTGQTHPPDRLAGSAGPVYALFRLDHEHLAGLSVAGELVIWDWHTHRLSATVAAPRPPACAALVKPRYWKQENLWVWPGREGILVFYRSGQRTVRTLSAHQGDLYAVTTYGEGLISAGATDRVIQFWQRGHDKPVRQQVAPDAMIAAEAWGGRDGQMLFINELGQATVYAVAGTAIDLVTTLPGTDYRVALGPNPAEFQLALAHHHAQQAQHLVEQADERIARRQWDELEPICQQLTDEGYPHVSWAFRGRQARICDDLLGELKAYHEVARIIPHDQAGSRDALVRYAELLELVWDPREALTIYQHLAGNGHTNGYRDRMARLSDLLAVMEARPCVIEAEVPLTVLVEAATVLGKKVTHRYHLLPTRAEYCKVCVPVDEVMERYGLLCAARPQTACAQEIELCWLTRDKRERAPAIVLRGEDDGPFPRLELVVRLLNVQGQTVVAPVIVLNAGATNPQGTAEHHNRAILDQFERVDNSPLLNSWYHTVYRDLRTIMRQLMTRGSSQRL